MMPAKLASLLLALLALCSLAPAQDVRFEPREHLDGYLEAYLGDHSDLFDFTPFEEAKGKRLSRSELIDLREAWQIERERVAYRAKKIETDPKEAFLYRIDRRMARSQFFQSIEVERIDTYDPIFFYIEKGKETYANNVAGLLGPWAVELQGMFADEIAGPAGVERDEDYPAIALIVLGSEGSYLNYAKAARAGGLRWSQAHYDSSLKMAITYRDIFGGGRTRQQARQPVLHELVHALQHAHSGDGNMPRETWFNEGLAEYLSYHLGHKPADLRKHPADRDAVRNLAPFTSTQFVGFALLPIEELCKVQNYSQAVGMIRKRGAMAGYDVPAEVAMSLLYAHSGLLMNFLFEGEEGKYRSAALRYVAAAQAGRGTPAELGKALGEFSTVDVDRAFVQFVRAQFLEMYPGGQLPELDLDQVGARTKTIEAASQAGVGAAFDPASLVVTELTAADRFGMAMLRAGAGECAAARADLEALRADAGELAPRVAAGIEAVQGWEDLRERFLLYLKSKRKKLNLRLPEARLLAHVERLEDGVVYLGSNRLKVESMTLEEIDGLALAEYMADKPAGFAPDWALALPYALDGQAEEALEVTGKYVAPTHLAGLLEALPDALSRARGLHALDGVAQASRDLDAAEGDALLEQLRLLVQDHSSVAAVSERRGALQALAHQLVSARFEPENLDELLHGKVEQLARSRVRITYTFDDVAELKDFEVEDEEYGLYGFPDELKPTAGEGFLVKGGALRGTGMACLRLPIDLQFATVRYDVMVTEPYSTRSGFFQIGVADDGLGNHGSAHALGALTLIDKASGTLRQMTKGVPQLMLGQRYHLELESKGDHLISRVDRKEIAKLLLTPRTRGEVFVSIASESPVLFEKIEVEGRLTKDALEDLEERWVEGQLAELGLAGR